MSGTVPWNNSDFRVAPWTAKVPTTISSSILGQMGQVRSPSASPQRIDVDAMDA